MYERCFQNCRRKVLAEDKILLTILQPDFIYNDERGALTQLFHSGYSQVNVIMSKKGAYRGGHYHKKNSEAFYIISGECELILSKDNENEEYNFHKGDYFRIDPYVMHSFRFVDETILVSMYTDGVEIDNMEKDIYQTK